MLEDGMKSLFDRTRLHMVELKNRGVRSATWEGMADEEGHLRAEHYEIYERLATGGIGLIITGMAGVLGPSPQMFGVYDDSFIEEYAELTSVVHKHRTPIVMQIAYQGSQGGLRIAGGKVWGLSSVGNRISGVTPREMTKDDIGVLVKSFAEAAHRAKKAGFDGVQLHAAHGYFLNQSLSPYYNRRSDEYGGSTENRARLLYEVYEAVREKVGEDYLVMAKVNGEDLFQGGLVLEESIAVCQGLQERGIDAIEVSGGQAPQRGGEHGIIRTGLEKAEAQSYFAHQAASIARQLHVPVMLVGGNRNPKLLEDILNTTGIEYVSFCRPLIREPNLLHRWQSGDLTEATCTSCNRCLRTAVRGKGLACVLEKVNP
jgi:2,4-dienoyl-CoA reductase-like NADH-dependent reductase (Old Yellow Enzyme family)